MEMKQVLLAGAIALGASAASAATVTIERMCGVIGDGVDANCGSYNIGSDAQFAFEGIVADGASSGSLTVDTYVNPFYDMAIAQSNVQLVLSFTNNAYANLSPGATLSFGGNSINLVEFGGSLVTTENLAATFAGAGVANSQPLTLAWSGLAGGEQISIRVAAIAAVPLPAGMLLLGTALGGLGFARRKKKAA
jgi:hypothetical protein